MDRRTRRRRDKPLNRNLTAAFSLEGLLRKYEHYMFQKALRFTNFLCLVCTSFSCFVGDFFATNEEHKNSGVPRKGRGADHTRFTHQETALFQKQTIRKYWKYLDAQTCLNIKHQTWFKIEIYIFYWFIYFTTKTFGWNAIKNTQNVKM